MLLWVDGFDHYGGDELNLTAGGSYSEVTEGSTNDVTIVTSQFRTNTHSLCLDANNASDTIGALVRKAFPNGALTQFGVGFAVYLPFLPATTPEQQVVFRDFNNADQFDVRIATTGDIQVVKGDGTVLGTTASPAITAAAWHHIEVYTVISQTVGIVKVWVNEELVLDLSGLDNVNTSLVECSQLAFITKGKFSAAATGAWYIDDFYIYDTSGSINNTGPIGDLSATLLVPTADTTEADWTKSTGTEGFSLIDETTPNDADYVQSATAGDRSDYDMTDLNSDITYVAGLFAHVRALKTDAGGAELKITIQQDSSQSSGDNQSITTAGKWWFQEIEIDPATGARFNRSGVNSAKIRIDRVS
jgi:hypothetical protein